VLLLGVAGAAAAFTLYQGRRHAQNRVKLSVVTYLFKKTLNIDLSTIIIGAAYIMKIYSVK
jgi:hypothetical protein